MEYLSPVDFRQIPIPELPSVAGWKEVPIVNNKELLVPLGPFSDNDVIFTDSIYFGERINSPYTKNPPRGSLATMFVRESVSQQLKKAQEMLPEEMHIIVFDSFRTLDVQGSLFDFYFNQLKEQNPYMDDDELLTETQKYVSLPSTDSSRPSPHNTGGSADLAIFELPREVEGQVGEINQRIIDAKDDWRSIYRLEMRKLALIAKNAKLLNFGTPFDWGGQEAALDYLEKEGRGRILSPDEVEARGNRRLLYHLMVEVGLEPYADEWWHYNSPKSQMGAKTSGKDFAQFGPASLSQENLAHEQMRVNHRLGSIRIFEGVRPFNKLGPEEILKAVMNSVRETGDIRMTSLSEAEIIAPKK